MHTEWGKVDHTVLVCPTIVNTEYLQRQDRVASFVHWILCKNFNLPRTEKWYEHKPQPSNKWTEVTILWDFTINTDRKIRANRPDITIKNLECIYYDRCYSSSR